MATSLRLLTLGFVLSLGFSCSSPKNGYGGNPVSVDFSFKDTAQVGLTKDQPISAWALSLKNWRDVEGKARFATIRNAPNAQTREVLISEFKYLLDRNHLHAFTPPSELKVPHGTIFYILIRGDKVVKDSFDSVDVKNRKRKPGF